MFWATQITILKLILWLPQHILFRNGTFYHFLPFYVASPINLEVSLQCLHQF
uniref:Uncharacterized protein n=1 Tax=Ceramothamnion japonicum TaxID=218448 RepID=A0A0E3DAX4_CERJP|nr:hypothetical protein Cjap.mt.13 [Ceramium japonicum]